MNANMCAPGKYDSKNNTCFTVEQLTEMVGAYNRYMTKTQLNPRQERTSGGADLINIKVDKKYLLSELRKRFETICKNDEVCLTQQAFMNEIVKEMRDDIINDTFRSIGPTNPKEWLSTDDINNIMSQYENVHPNFKFFGAVPLNCDELSFCSLYKLDFDKYVHDNIDYVGVVFNLDRHGQPGSHWVALFIDIKHGEINFCDSNGRQPVDNISEIINQFTKFYKKKTGTDAKYKYNTIPYQKDGSECGVYSCNFIIRKLSGESFDQIVGNALNFKNINSCRNAYFRNMPSSYRVHNKCDPK